MSDFIIFSDGSNSDNRGNGPAGAAFIVYLDGVPFQWVKIPTQRGTNNDMEMLALKEAICYFADMRNEDDTAIFKADSQWAVRTVAGYLNLAGHPVKYGITPKSEKFVPMLESIKRVWDNQRMQIYWIPRESNREADKLATQARLKALEMYK